MHLQSRPALAAQHFARFKRLRLAFFSCAAEAGKESYLRHIVATRHIILKKLRNNLSYYIA
jgi:hypothetical protein